MKKGDWCQSTFIYRYSFTDCKISIRSDISFITSLLHFQTRFWILASKPDVSFLCTGRSWTSPLAASQWPRVWFESFQGLFAYLTSVSLCPSADASRSDTSLHIAIPSFIRSFFQFYAVASHSSIDLLNHHPSDHEKSPRYRFWIIQSIITAWKCQIPRRRLGPTPANGEGQDIAGRIGCHIGWGHPSGRKLRCWWCDDDSIFQSGWWWHGPRPSIFFIRKSIISRRRCIKCSTAFTKTHTSPLSTHNLHILYTPKTFTTLLWINMSEPDKIWLCFN